MDIAIEVSARHVHLSCEDVQTLFGKGSHLTKKRDLSTPGYFLCNEKVTVTGPKGSLEMSVLGPERKKTQVEVALSDAIRLGIEVPLRESGDLTDSAGVRLIGPYGEVNLTEGVIAAKRHIHLTPEMASSMGFRENQLVSVAARGERELIFKNIIIRTDPSYVYPSMHIDTDEANAAGIHGVIRGEIL